MSSHFLKFSSFAYRKTDFADRAVVGHRVGVGSPDPHKTGAETAPLQIENEDLP